MRISERARAGSDSSGLFYGYRTNVNAYPNWQAWLQQAQPRLLILWGKHDPSFDIGEPERYPKDVPNAAVHVLDAGYFALDAKAGEIAELVRDFMSASARKAREDSTPLQTRILPSG